MQPLSDLTQKLALTYSSTGATAGPRRKDGNNMSAYGVGVVVEVCRKE
jgi:hypothetical protein